VIAALLLLAAAPVVASVELQAAPAERARLLRYVEIPTGEPLKPEALRASIQRLYATGEFEDVVVLSETDAAGLHLRLVPTPAPRLVDVRVEGDRVLNAGALKRAARLQAGEALWPARLEAAATQAALALGQRGYLEARVDAEARRRPGGADAVFVVHAGPRVRVSKAEIAEAPAGTEPLLRPLVRPRPGESFERRRAQSAADKMRQALVKNGRWRARVELEESYDPKSARVALRFMVRSGPWQRVDFRGAPTSGGVASDVERLLREGGVSLDAREAGAERIEQALQDAGHRDAAARHHVEEAPGGEIVVYDVEAGPAWTAASVKVSGADPDLALRLATQEGAPVRDETIGADERLLTQALEEQGYFEARVEVDIPEKGGRVPVVFRAEPGPKAQVAAFAISVDGGLDTPRSASPRELVTREGRPYRLRDLALDRRSLLAAWRNAGYLEAEVTPEVAFDEERTAASVTLRVTPGERTDVDRIVVRGLRRTQEVVVRRELLLKEGEPLGLSDLLESQRRLGALTIFERASLVELPADEPGRRSLVADVQEAPRTTIAYGIGYGDRDRLRGSLELTRRNLFGLDRSLTAFARGSFVSSRFQFTYREPYLLSRKLELYLTGFREEEDREAFDYIRGGFIAQSLFTLKTGRTLITRVTYQKTDTFNVTVPEDEVDRQFRDATISGPSFSILEDSRDDPLDPRRGLFVALDVQLSLDALGGDPFLKSYLQAAHYRRVLPRTLIATSARLGLARTYGFPVKTRLPLPERFFAGGDFSFRGFETDAVLPEGGNGLLLGSVELRFDASKRISLAAFSDFGNVYPFVSDIDLDDMRASAGGGVRLKSPFGPVRLDWARLLDPRPGEPTSRIHLTVGHAF
jgi:outer membrane protein assembly complex protein YaeT